MPVAVARTGGETATNWRARSAEGRSVWRLSSWGPTAESQQAVRAGSGHGATLLGAVNACAPPRAARRSPQPAAMSCLFMSAHPSHHIVRSARGGATTALLRYRSRRTACVRPIPLLGAPGNVISAGVRTGRLAGPHLQPDSGAKRCVVCPACPPPVPPCLRPPAHRCICASPQRCIAAVTRTAAGKRPGACRTSSQHWPRHFITKFLHLYPARPLCPLLSASETVPISGPGDPSPRPASRPPACVREVQKRSRCLEERVPAIWPPCAVRRSARRHRTPPPRVAAAASARRHAGCPSFVQSTWRACAARSKAPPVGWPCVPPQHRPRPPSNRPKPCCRQRCRAARPSSASQ